MLEQLVNSTIEIELEVPSDNPYNNCMMNEKDRTDQINERMMEDQGLRGLGGTRTVVSYTDIVMNVHSAIKDLSDDNQCEFGTNLLLFVEGLVEDVNELEQGCEVRLLPIRPKSSEDVDYDEKFQL